MNQPTLWTKVKSGFLSQNGYFSQDEASGDNSNRKRGLEAYTTRFIVPFKENPIETMKEFILKGDYTDVKVMIGNTCFQCHMLILKNYSGYFKKNLKEKVICLPTEIVTVRGFTLAYDWMLQDNTRLQRKGFMDMFTTAQYLDISGLINQCWEYLDDERFSEEVIFNFYCEAGECGLYQLKELLLSRITIFFLELVSCQEYLKMNKDEVLFLLQSNRICINTEIEIFYCAIHWLSYDWEERKSALIDLMNSVRFQLMPVWTLGKLLTPCEALEVNRVICQPMVQTIIRAALTEVSVRESIGKLGQECSVTTRNWAYDKNCTYHHLPSCPRKAFPTYSSFMQYLLSIQVAGSKYKGSLKVIKDVDASVKCC